MLVLILTLLLLPWPFSPAPVLTIETDEPPQAFAAAQGIVYILHTDGNLEKHQGGKKKALTLEATHQGGSFAIVDDGYIVLRNLLPLDQPREILRYDKFGNLRERTTLPADPVMQRPLTSPDGQELLIFPQTVQVQVLGENYLISNSDGRYWLFGPDQDQVKAYPGPIYSVEPGRLVFYPKSKCTIKTTGQAVNIRRLGRDKQGVEYWSFTDFYDHDNFRHIVTRTDAKGTTFADITNFADSRLTTWVCLDPSTGAIYTAQTEAEKYLVYRIRPRQFSPTYPDWSPEPGPHWFNRHSDNILVRQNIAAAEVWRNEQLGPKASIRFQVWERALAYVDYRWTLDYSAHSITPSGQLAGMLPRWLEPAQSGSEIRGLPYCWGGCVTLETFQAQLDRGWQAGNILPQGNWQPGTTGVDCSGLVWNCYGYNTRPGGGGTSISSPRHWTQIPNNELVWMDMARIPGHVVLFVAREPNNPDMFYTIESTGAHGNDRVMMWYRHFSQGYQGLRYNGLYRRVSQDDPVLCPDAMLLVVHRQTEDFIEDGNHKTRTLETVACSVCRRQWLRETHPGDK